MWNPNRAPVPQGRDREFSPLLKESITKAETLLEESAIHPEEFSDLYGASVIEKDLELAARLHAKFENDEDTTKKLARLFEALVFEQAELSNWLGEGVETIKTSEYDDYVNGVDMLAEFNEGGNNFSHLALAVDVTFGTKGLGDKFARIKGEIESGKLGYVKYFQSSRQGIRGELSQVPRAVIGVERDTLAQLAGLWTTGKKTHLANHEVQRVIAEELVAQMKVFLACARKTQNERAVTAYTRALRICSRVLDDKQKIPLESEDKVFQGIRSELERF